MQILDEPRRHRRLLERRDHDIALRSDLFNDVPRLSGLEIEGQRLLALVVEQMPQPALIARFAVDPRSNSANPIAVGRLDPDHPRAKIGEVAARADHRLVGQVKHDGAAQRHCISHGIPPPTPSSQNMAIGLIGEAVPPTRRSGAIVSRNSQRLRSAQASATGPSLALSIRWTPMYVMMMW